MSVNIEQLTTRTENGTISDPTGDRRAQRLRELGYTTDQISEDAELAKRDEEVN